jgi:hypothetical protein
MIIIIIKMKNLNSCNATEPQSLPTPPPAKWTLENWIATSDNYRVFKNNFMTYNKMTATNI